MEGPTHLALRRVMNTHLVPKAVAAMRPLMQAAATWFLDQHVEDGHMDMVEHLTSPVPSVLTMHLVGLPLLVRRLVLAASFVGAATYAATRIAVPLARRVSGFYAARTIEVADRTYVLRSGGRVAFHGTAQELAQVGDFETAYIGMSTA